MHPQLSQLLPDASEGTQQRRDEATVRADVHISLAQLIMFRAQMCAAGGFVASRRMHNVRDQKRPKDAQVNSCMLIYGQGATDQHAC